MVADMDWKTSRKLRNLQSYSSEKLKTDRIHLANNSVVFLGFMKRFDKLYAMTDNEFVEIDWADIRQKRNGWRMP